MPFPRTLVAAAALGLAACGGSAAPRAPAGAPNVLLISIDTQRADHLGIYGYARPTSPHLDGFAKGAVVFDDAQGSAPWTLAALASVMTGEIVSTHNCWHYSAVLDDSFQTLPERLLVGGYDTACVVSHVFTTSRHGLQQGFVHTDDTYAYPEIDPSLNITSQVISDKAITFLDEKKASPDKAPWFLWLHYFDPHREYMEHPGISENFVTPGERSQGTALSDIYDGEVRYTDEHVGRVLEHLNATGFDQDTIVILIADHGEEFRDHGGLGHGHSLHRELVHVPLAFRVPGIAPRRVTDMVRQVDVLPTVLDLVGLPIPPGIAGRSLVPALRGQPLPPVGALSELDTGPLRAEAWIEGRYKLIRDEIAGTRELYDVEADPLETKDLAAEHPDVVKQLEAELDLAREHGRERAKLFGQGTHVVLTPGQEHDLSALGYVGNDDASAPPEGVRPPEDAGEDHK